MAFLTQQNIAVNRKSASISHPIPFPIIHITSSSMGVNMISAKFWLSMEGDISFKYCCNTAKPNGLIAELSCVFLLVTIIPAGKYL